MVRAAFDAVIGGVLVLASVARAARLLSVDAGWRDFFAGVARGLVLARRISVRRGVLVRGDTAVRARAFGNGAVDKPRAQSARRLVNAVLNAVRGRTLIAQGWAVTADTFGAGAGWRDLLACVARRLRFACGFRGHVLPLGHPVAILADTVCGGRARRGRDLTQRAQIRAGRATCGTRVIGKRAGGARLARVAIIAGLGFAGAARGAHALGLQAGCAVTLTGWTGGLGLARALSRLILVGVDGARRAHGVVRGVGWCQHPLAGGTHGGSHAAGLAGLILVLAGGARGARLGKPVGGGELAGWAVGAHRGRHQVQRRRKLASRAVLLGRARLQPVIGLGLVLAGWASAAGAHYRGIKVRDLLAGAALGLLDARGCCNINDKIWKAAGCGVQNSKGSTDGRALVRRLGW